MAWEEAVSSQTIATMVCNKPHFIPSFKPDVRTPTGRGVAILPGGEGMENQLPISQQINTGSVFVEGTVELEFIHTWMLTGEIPWSNVIAVLSIVDDITEGKGNTRRWEVVA